MYSTDGGPYLSQAFVQIYIYESILKFFWKPLLFILPRPRCRKIPNFVRISATKCRRILGNQSEFMKQPVVSWIRIGDLSTARSGDRPHPKEQPRSRLPHISAKPKRSNKWQMWRKHPHVLLSGPASGEPSATRNGDSPHPKKQPHSRPPHTSVKPKRFDTCVPATQSVPAHVSRTQPTNTTSPKTLLISHYFSIKNKF